MRLAFLEPHLRRYGGIRRIVELSNALVARGHEVTLVVPDYEPATCTWMRCDARVLHLSDAVTEPYDVVTFNHEPQWYLLDRFEHADLRVFYALHYGRLYAKEGSWESLRVPVDLQLANSTWTADQVEAETGRRPEVLTGGVNAEHFHPLDVPRRYPLLCVGDTRDWKGTDTIEEAAARLGLPLEAYAPKDLDQSEMAREYASAEVFVVGSHFEGFGQPGLEALACGTPLVTTDNGGCRDYAVDGETALVVPPRDPSAMADAILRLRSDPGLAATLRRNGLDLVAEVFRWERSAERFEALVGRAAAAPERAREGSRALREPEPSPRLSLVVLQWNQHLLTQRCVESLRQHTDVPYELVLVDNGSDRDGREYATAAADVAVPLPENLGFAKGMNAGFEQARGEYVAFLNNDTVFPPAWASRLLEAFEGGDRVGMVVPALTAGGNERTVRTEPGTAVEVLQPFEAPPSGVAYVLRTDDCRELGAWPEEYAVASGEDVDLCFTLWTNDLDIVYDTRVLVDHVGHATSDTLDGRVDLWARNRQHFLHKWGDASVEVPRLSRSDPERFQRNRATAAAVAEWMRRYFNQRDLRQAESRRRAERGVPGTAAAIVRPAWRLVRRLVPPGLRLRLYRRFRDTYYAFFPERHPAVLRGERRRPRPPR